MNRLAIDTETALIRPGLLAPPLTCVTTSAGRLHWVHEPGLMPWVREWLQDPNLLLIGHNIAFDLAVIAAEWPELLEPIFTALANDRITDTGIRQKLIDIARGQFRGITDALSGHRTEHTYSLDALSQRHGFGEMDKSTHRLGFGELRDVTPSEWPEGAAAYAVKDAVTTLGVYEAQREWANFLKDEFRQARAAFGLHLISCWGIRTDGEAIDRFEAETVAAYERAVELCREHGLVRANGTRDTKKAKALMLTACADLDISPKRTDGYIKLKRKDPDELTAAERKRIDDPLGGLALDEDACLETGNDVLKAYSEVSSLMTVVKTHIPALHNGVLGPIQPRFDSLMETGRTSCKGYSEGAPTNGYQMHNVRRLAGIRECFVPRPGRLFLDADYDGLELRTVAQVCLWALGESRLAEVLNDGVDPHLDLAAQLLGITYDEALTRLKAGDEKVAGARQFAKVGNFGFPGGMQPKSFRDHARKQYGLKMSLREAEELYEAWLSAWPEFRQYFEWIRVQCGEAKVATITHFKSERLRGMVPFTVASNSFFQGLGADATKAALFAIQRECFTVPESPLFGARMVNYVHDEFMLEVPDDLALANAAAKRLVSVMCSAADEWLPDVPTKATAALMRAWSKNAKPVFNSAGQLIPWEPST